jgi:hypothetical protein
MIIDGKYYDAVTPQLAIEILHNLSPAAHTVDAIGEED